MRALDIKIRVVWNIMLLSSMSKNINLFILKNQIIYRLFLNLYMKLRVYAQYQNINLISLIKRSFSFYLVFCIDFQWHPCSRSISSLLTLHSIPPGMFSIVDYLSKFVSHVCFSHHRTLQGKKCRWKYKSEYFGTNKPQQNSCGYLCSKFFRSSS